MQYVEKIHVTADVRTLKSRNLYIPANGARSQFMKVTSIWTVSYTHLDVYKRQRERYLMRMATYILDGI